MVLKKLVALNLALALFGTAGSVDKEPLQVNDIPTIQEALKGVYDNQNLLNGELKMVLSEPHKKIEVELIDIKDEGQYWLDEDSDFEPVIFVENDFAEHWGIDDYKIGDKAVGVFDSTGWELLAIQK